MNLYCSISESKHLLKSHLIATKDVLPRGWKVSFKLNPFGIEKDWSSVLHATIGKNHGRYGDRTPGIWFSPGTTKLTICSAVNGNVNYCYSSVLSKNKETTIVVQQVQSQKNHQYYFQVYINGKKAHEILNKSPQIFKNVKYYAGDPWYNPAKAVLTDFKLVTYKHKGEDRRRYL